MGQERQVGIIYYDAYLNGSLLSVMGSDAKRSGVGALARVRKSAM